MIISLLLPFAHGSGCPLGFMSSSPTEGVGVSLATPLERVAPTGFHEAFQAIDFAAVKADIAEVLSTSQDWWPADYGHYGPLMVRLAWHAAGSYRITDGRGGADGGRMLFDPERSWPDNTNLDKARKLLEPIKNKYGVGLSWGDLLVLAGDTAIDDMGLPTFGFCGGRIDDDSGFWSELLGPNSEQEDVFPCEDPVQCAFENPFAANQVGLVYVNPEGPGGNPDPELSAIDIRQTFSRMGMDDEETVALVGGGHAFGKVHGACPDGAGPNPMEDPEDPWPGMCGSGMGRDTYTSGFEGPWTSNPTTWSNEYFVNLVSFDWEQYIAAGGHVQWQVVGGESAGTPQAPHVDFVGVQNVTMLTADVALINDPEGSYNTYVEQFATFPETLDKKFSETWYKLMTRDMGPHTRCLEANGITLPPAQDWQDPLPDALDESQLADFDEVKAAIEAVLTTSNAEFPADTYDMGANYAPLFVRLAWQCASTFRTTDYIGGCNGARIRLEPQASWFLNTDLDNAMMVLEGIKNEFGDGLSWADLIVLAGNTALEYSGSVDLPFCGGRVDATTDVLTHVLEVYPRLTGSMDDNLLGLGDYALTHGLTAREFTALMGGHTLGKMHEERTGYTGEWTESPLLFNNEYFVNLVTEEWETVTVDSSGMEQYKAVGKDIYILRPDYLLRLDPEFYIAVQEFASDEAVWKIEFAAAWTKMMNADRFDGPTGNLCPSYTAWAMSMDSDDSDSDGSSTGSDGSDSDGSSTDGSDSDGSSTDGSDSDGSCPDCHCAVACDGDGTDGSSSGGLSGFTHSSISDDDNTHTADTLSEGGDTDVSIAGDTFEGHNIDVSHTVDLGDATLSSDGDGSGDWKILVIAILAVMLIMSWCLFVIVLVLTRRSPPAKVQYVEARPTTRGYSVDAVESKEVERTV